MLPAKGRTFDPARIRNAVKEAGFTPGEIEVTAAGTLVSKGEMRVLQLPGVVPEFVLAGGAKAGELTNRTDLFQKKLRVTGKLHPSHADKPPGLTVERWSLMSGKNGINACKLLGIAFTTAVGILMRSWEKGLLEGPDALIKLAKLAKYGRYKDSIIEDARLKLEGKP